MRRGALRFGSVVLLCLSCEACTEAKKPKPAKEASRTPVAPEASVVKTPVKTLKELGPFYRTYVHDEWLIVNLPSTSPEDWDRIALSEVDTVPAGSKDMPRDVVELGRVYVVSETGVTPFETFSRAGIVSGVGWHVDFPRRGVEGVTFGMATRPPEGTILHPGGKRREVGKNHPLAVALRKAALEKYPDSEQAIALMDRYDVQVSRGRFEAADRVAVVDGSGFEPGAEFGEGFSLLATLNAEGTVVETLAVGDGSFDVKAVTDVDGDGIDELFMLETGIEFWEWYIARVSSETRDWYSLETFEE